MEARRLIPNVKREAMSGDVEVFLELSRMVLEPFSSAAAHEDFRAQASKSPVPRIDRSRNMLPGKGPKSRRPAGEAGRFFLG
jgi:hypothetical protein